MSMCSLKKISVKTLLLTLLLLLLLLLSLLLLFNSCMDALFLIEHAQLKK